MLRSASLVFCALLAEAVDARPPSLPDAAERIDAIAKTAIDSGTTVGLSVVVIRDGRAVWQRSYGRANAWSRSPVRNDTPMPAASLGKPLAALVALRAVARGEFGLDSPLPTPWRIEPAGAVFTVRQILEHSSGLSNFLGERTHRLAAAPGTRFRYSGVGFLLLQDTLTAKTGESLNEITARDVLQPLGMHSTRYGRGMRGEAAGHMPFGRAMVPGAIVMMPLVLAVSVALLVARRLRTGIRSRPWLLAAVGAMLALLLTVVFLFERSGSWRAALFFTLLPSLAAASALIVSAAIHRLAPRLGRIRSISVGLAGATMLISLLHAQALPLPDLGARCDSAASSLRASASDLARLLAELARPTLLPEPLAIELTVPARRVDSRVGWGLGVALAESPNGRVLWHRGSSPGSNGLMMIELTRGDGVVVLANHGDAGDVVNAIAEAATGVRPDWRVRAEK